MQTSLHSNRPARLESAYKLSQLIHYKPVRVPSSTPYRLTTMFKPMNLGKINMFCRYLCKIMYLGDKKTLFSKYIQANEFYP